MVCEGWWDIFYFSSQKVKKGILKYLELLFTLQNYEKKTCSNNQHSIDLFAIYVVVEREKRSTVDV